MDCTRCGDAGTEPGANWTVVTTIPCSKCRPWEHFKWRWRTDLGFRARETAILVLSVLCAMIGLAVLALAVLP